MYQAFRGAWCTTLKYPANSGPVIRSRWQEHHRSTITVHSWDKVLFCMAIFVSTPNSPLVFVAKNLFCLVWLNTEHSPTESSHNVLQTIEAFVGPWQQRRSSCSRHQTTCDYAGGVCSWFVKLSDPKTWLISAISHLWSLEMLCLLETCTSLWVGSV